MEKNLSKEHRFGALISLVMAAALLAGGFFLVTRAEQAVKSAQAAPADSPVLAEKVIVVNVTGTVNIIDTATDIVYGPYMSGTLGSPGGGTYDVAVTPDGNTALISNFGDSAVFFVDVSDPFNPTFIVSATLPMFAEDIAISADGRFALVTDGGLSTKIVTLDLISHTLVYTADLGTRYSNAVAVAPNGTVVVADYFLGEISALKLEDTGELTYMGSYSYTIGADGVVTPSVGLSAQPLDVPGRPDQAAPEIPLGVSAVYTSTLMHPVNIAIAPDGQTVLVCNVTPYWSNDTSALFHMGVYLITDPGVLSFSSVVTGLSRAVQSLAFSPDGHQAYLSGNGIVNTNNPYINHDQLMVLDIVGPGDVHLEANNVSDYPRQTASQLFGVDTITLANGKLYLGYPTIGGGDNILRIIKVDDFSVLKRDVSGIPSGVGVLPVKKIYIPAVYK
jgi:hypothetical protein